MRSVLTLTIFARKSIHDEAKKKFYSEVGKDKHWKGHKVPAETVYQRTCEALEWEFIRYDSLKNELVVAVN